MKVNLVPYYPAMKAKTVARHGLRLLAYGLPLCLLLVVVFYIFQLQSRPALRIWHEVELDAEFTEDSGVEDFDGYLQAEGKVFVQLEKLVYGSIEPEDQHLVNRYHAGSLSDPACWRPNLNRTFELQVDEPKAGVLLLHGMSDSPYSLHEAGERLHELGAWVVGLRLPGHGTVPSGLVHVHWKDMAAAARLGVRHLREEIGDAPLYIVGYSNGGALAVHYALTTLEDSELPRADGLVLVSPSIGVTSMAQLAVWQARLGSLLGLDKLAWSSIQPEYDPFKYRSFAVNAGDQVYRLTVELDERLTELDEQGTLEQLPPILAFQSAVDATVSSAALVTGLFGRLPKGGHELVVFDVNRTSEVARLLTSDPREELESLLSGDPRPMAISVLTNGEKTVVERKRVAGEQEVVETPTELSWPREVYSLSHISLPFSSGDPLYGRDGPEDDTRIHLGDMQLRGERGALRVPAQDMLRLRWNPFYDYFERRLVEFIGLGE